MTFSNTSSLNLGNLLQIVFSNGVRNQISVDFRDWTNIKRAKVGNSLARELRFMFQSSLGPAAIQYRNPGTSGRSFPQSQQSSVNEYTAQFKEINATIELEYNLWDRARKSPEKYAEPLALEIDSKASASKRRIAADLYGDGTGVVGQLPASSAALSSPASNQLVFTLSSSDSARGHVGFFEYGDILLLQAAASGAGTLDTNLATEPAYWKVIDKSRSANTVTLQGLDANLAAVATISAISVQPAAGEVFYRYGQPTIPNLTSISDYGTVSEVMAGLESLASNDGRVVHGITMSGANASSTYDAGANPLDVKHIQRVMSQAKVQVGQDRYKWKMMSMAPESLDALIESRETDRRFVTKEDGARGVKVFSYIHQNDELECYTSEYVPMKRLYILPETKASEKVLEFHGSDFETVKAQGYSDFHLKPGSGGGHVNNVISYLQSVGVIICKHPAAIARIKNFTNAQLIEFLLVSSYGEPSETSLTAWISSVSSPILSNRNGRWCHLPQLLHTMPQFSGNWKLSEEW